MIGYFNDLLPYGPYEHETKFYSSRHAHDVHMLWY